MIFSDHLLTELRSTGINSANLKTMILQLAVKCQELEKELKNGSNTEGDSQGADSADKTG